MKEVNEFCARITRELYPDITFTEDRDKEGDLLMRFDPEQFRDCSFRLEKTLRRLCHYREAIPGFIVPRISVRRCVDRDGWAFLYYTNLLDTRNLPKGEIPQVLLRDAVSSADVVGVRLILERYQIIPTMTVLLEAYRSPKVRSRSHEIRQVLSQVTTKRLLLIGICLEQITWTYLEDSIPTEIVRMIWILYLTII